MERVAGSLPLSPTDPSNVDLGARIDRAVLSEECLALAAAAEQAGLPDAAALALDRAIGLDRNNRDALVMSAAAALERGDSASAFVLLEEAHRAGVLPDEAAQIHADLVDAAGRDPRLENYFRIIGRVQDRPVTTPLSIVVVTNLLPPQELGGYGRMIWEFAHGLAGRGHRVRVLTANVPSLAKVPVAEEVAMESNVNRSLELLGHWEGGRAIVLSDQGEQRRRVRENATRIDRALTEAQADLLLAGNLDFLGVGPLQIALRRRVPVIHALANALPGYHSEEMPQDPCFCVAPCSTWNGEALRGAGYIPGRMETLYPGARIDRFFRFFLPDTRSLRISYASLALPYKGVDTLVAALLALGRAGVEFTAEIAGDQPDQEFINGLQAQLREAGLQERVRFTGFLDRNGLSALFSRSNILVFPSKFEEPFGISQVEAMAAGLVVVSSGTGGAKEIVRDRVDGLLFPAGDAGKLALKLASLAKDSDLFAYLQRASQRRAQAFSVSSAVRRIEEIAADLRRANGQQDGVSSQPRSDLRPA